MEEVVGERKVVKGVGRMCENVGEIGKGRREVEVVWWMGGNKWIEFEKGVVVGDGMCGRVGRDVVDGKRGGMVGLEVKEVDGLGVGMDGEGKVLVEGDGNGLIFE